MTIAGGFGEALDGTGSASSGEPLAEDALQDKLIAEADAQVAAASAKVDKQRAHLEGAEQALAEAIAEREGI